MKKLFVILGFVSLAITGFLFAIGYMIISKRESELNAKKTAPARAARWKGKEEEEQPLNGQAVETSIES